MGLGWTAAAQELNLERSDFFLQTKYTPYPGQDPNNIPYDHTGKMRSITFYEYLERSRMGCFSL